MSLSLVIPYFTKHLTALGFREWPDSFDIDRIPETIMNHAFHIAVTSGDFGPINQTVQDSETTVEVSVIFKGHRSERDARDEAIHELTSIVKEICKVKNRTSTLQNVVATGFEIEALNEQNDRSAILRIAFSAFVSIGIEES